MTSPYEWKIISRDKNSKTNKQSNWNRRQIFIRKYGLPTTYYTMFEIRFIDKLDPIRSKNNYLYLYDENLQHKLISIWFYMIYFPYFQHTHQLPFALHHSKATILYVSLTFPRILSPSTVTCRIDTVVLVGSCSRYRPSFHGKKNSSVNILQASLVWHCAPSFHTEGQWNPF